MADNESWDWEPGEKRIDVGEWRDQFNWVEEPQASPDGEKIAAIVNIDEGEFKVCENGSTWEDTFDKIWYLRFSPDGRLTAIVSDTGEWTLAVDGSCWENQYDYVWNTQFSEDGQRIALCIQTDMTYCMSIDDTPWDDHFASMNTFVFNPAGSATAAAVQVEEIGEADILKFQEGAFTAALNCKAWDSRFVNVWGLAISADGQNQIGRAHV